MLLRRWRSLQVESEQPLEGEEHEGEITEESTEFPFNFEDIAVYIIENDEWLEHFTYYQLMTCNSHAIPFLFRTLKGGYASGFRHVKPEEYRPRLLHFCREGKITYMREVKFSKQSVHSGDVFILDLGDRAYQFNGATSSAFERSAVSPVLIKFLRRDPIIISLFRAIGCRFPTRFGMQAQWSLCHPCFGGSYYS